MTTVDYVCSPTAVRVTASKPSATVPDVSVCIANWNCRDYLFNCLHSLLRQEQGVSVEVIVVDNASSDGAADMVRREFPEVILTTNTENRGFAQASNQAADRSSGRYLFFLNNDTLVPERALEKLVAFADTHPQVGLIGPRLINGRGHLQISYRRKPTWRAMLHRTALLRWTGLLKGTYRDYRRDNFLPTEVTRVEVLMGAAVLCPRHVYHECGGWDDDFRFGVEDVEFSDRIGRTYPLVHLPGVEVIHYGRVSSRQNISFAAPNLMIGYVRYFRKSGASRFGLWTYKALFTLDAPIQVIGKSLRFLWRLVTSGSSEKTEKSRIALAGDWNFLTRELLRFWRA